MPVARSFHLCLALGLSCAAHAQGYYLRPGATDLANPASWEASSGEAPERFTTSTQLHVLLPDSLHLRLGTLAVGSLRFDTQAGVHLEDGRLVGKLLVDNGQGHRFERIAVAGEVVLGKAMSGVPVTIVFQSCNLVCRRAATASTGNRPRVADEVNNPLASLIVHSGAAVEFLGPCKVDVDCAHLNDATLRNSHILFDRLFVGGTLVATAGSRLQARGATAQIELRLTGSESNLQACDVETPKLVVRLGADDKPALLKVDTASAWQIGTFDVGGTSGSRVIVNGKSLAAVAREGGQGRDLQVDVVTLHIGEPGDPGFELASAALLAQKRAIVFRGCVRLVHGYRPARLASEGLLLVGKADVELVGGRLQGNPIRILDDLEQIQRTIGPGVDLPGSEAWEERAQVRYAHPRGQAGQAEAREGNDQKLREQLERLARKEFDLANADLKRWVEIMQAQASGPVRRALLEVLDAAGGDVRKLDVGRIAEILRQFFAQQARSTKGKGQRKEQAAGEAGAEDAEGTGGAGFLGDLVQASAAGFSEPDYATVVRGHGVLVGTVELDGQLRPEDTLNHLGSAHAMDIEGDLHMTPNGGIQLPISVDTRITFGAWSGTTQFVHDHLGGDLGDRLAQAWVTLWAMIDEGINLGSVFGSVHYYKRAFSAAASKALFVAAVASFAADVVQYAGHGGAHFPVHASGRLDLGSDPGAVGVLRPVLQPDFIDELAAGQMFRGLRADGTRTGRRAHFPAVIEDCVAVVPETGTPEAPAPLEPPPVLTPVPVVAEPTPPTAPESNVHEPPAFVAVPMPVPTQPAEDRLFFFEDYAHKQVNIGVAKLPRRLWLSNGRLHSEPLSAEGVQAQPLRSHISVVIHGADSVCDPDTAAAALGEVSGCADAVPWPVPLETEVRIEHVAAAHLFAASALGLADRCEVWLVDWREFATGAEDTHGWASGASLFSYLTERALTRRVDAYVRKLPGLGHGWTGSRRFLADSVVGHSTDVVSGIATDLLAMLGFDVEVFHAGVFLEASRIALQIGKGLGHWFRESHVSLSAVESVDVMTEGAGLWLGLGLVDSLRHTPGWRAESRVFAFGPPLGFDPERMRALGLGSFVEGLAFASDAMASGTCRITLLGDARLSAYTGLAPDGAWSAYARAASAAPGVPMAGPDVVAFDVAWSDPQMNFSVRWQHAQTLIDRLGEDLPSGLRIASQLEDVVWSATAGIPTQRWVEGQLHLDRETRTPKQATQILALAKSRGVIDSMHPNALFHGVAALPPNLWSRGAVWPMEFYVRTVIGAVREKRGRGPVLSPWAVWHDPRDAAIGFASSGLAAAAGVGATETLPRKGLCQLPTWER